MRKLLLSHLYIFLVRMIHIGFIFSLFLLLSLSSNVSSQYPDYDWNTTKLGVSVFDIFNFKLIEFNQYFSENDTHIQYEIHLNHSASILHTETADELVEIGEFFSITIMSDPYFNPIYNPSVRFEKDDTKYNLNIPLVNVSLSHNSFVDDRIMKTMIPYDPYPNFYGSHQIDSLIFVPDWEIYQYIYPNEEFTIDYNETEYSYIFNYSSSFDLGLDTITYDVHSSYDLISGNVSLPQNFNYDKQAIIDKKTGLVTNLRWQFSTSEGGVFIMILEGEAFNQSTDLLGQGYSPFLTVTSFSIVCMIVMRKKRKN